MSALGRLGVRHRLLAAVVAAVAVALAGGVAGFHFLLEDQLESDARALVEAEAEAQASALDVRGGRIAVERSAGRADDVVWVFARGGTALVAPRVSARLDAAARSLAGGPARTLRLGDERLLRAAPVVRGGVRFGTVVAAVSLRGYEETKHSALVGSVILAGALLGGVAILAWVVLGRAFAPVARMTEQAASWSEDELDRRFDLGEPYDELTRLGATLDGLLERIAASLRHEQRFTAELSHELRTPLARIGGEAELALRRERTPTEYREALEAIARSAGQMTRTVDALVAAARQEAGLSRATSDVRDAVRAAAEGAPVAVSLPPEPVPVAAGAELVRRMVEPLLQNALRYGRPPVTVEVARSGRRATVRVLDAGPGVAVEEAGRIFEPGERGGAATDAEGAGLGLALARRLARSAGGDVTVEPGERGNFRLDLPLA